MRLIKAGIKRFFDYCREQESSLSDRSFTIGYQNDIPRLVGLSTNSAIVTAVIRVLMEFYEVRIPPHDLPTLALSVEKEELGLTAGLMDRVIQSYEGIVYHGLRAEAHGRTRVRNLRAAVAREIPPLYVAYDPERSEVTDDAPTAICSRCSAAATPPSSAQCENSASLPEAGKTALIAAEWERWDR